MVVYAILLIFTLLALYAVNRRKNLTAVIIVYLIIDPCIKIGGYSFDSSYIYLLILFVILILTNSKLRVYRRILEFAAMYLVWMLMYTVGWVVGGMNELGTYFTSMLGLVKIIAAVCILMISFQYNDKQSLDQTIGLSTAVGLFLNAAAVFLQWLIPVQMYNLCYELYYSASATGYVSSSTVDTWGGGFYKGSYYRYFGLFDTPMIFACFLIFVLSLWVLQGSSTRRFYKYPKIVALTAFICGILTQCKVFILMMPILLIFYVLFNLSKLTKAKTIIFMAIALAALFIIVNADNLTILTRIFGSNIKYLTDPLSALATRFGSDDSSGYLSSTLTVARNYIFTGVGPVSIEGEPIADSSYVVLLHNGGILTIVALAVYYIIVCVRNIKCGEGVLNILIYSLLIMGVSRTVLIFGPLVILCNFYILENWKLAKESINDEVVYADNRGMNLRAYRK